MNIVVWKSIKTLWADLRLALEIQEVVDTKDSFSIHVASSLLPELPMYNRLVWSLWPHLPKSIRILLHATQGFIQEFLLGGGGIISENPKYYHAKYTSKLKRGYIFPILHESEYGQCALIVTLIMTIIYTCS